MNKEFFFFHFSGHGSNTKGRFFLVPYDGRTPAPTTHITAKVLMDWLREAQCRAKYIVFILDCCSADRISKDLIKIAEEDNTFNTKLFVMGASLENREALLEEKLDCTIFSYFLSYAISVNVENNLVPVILPTFDLCRDLTAALTSLIVHCVIETEELENNVFRKIPVLKYGKMEPKAHTTNAMPGRRTEHSAIYDTEHSEYLHQECILWLKEKCDPEGGLWKLHDEGVLADDEKLLKTVLCYMMVSIASLQRYYTYYDGVKKVDNRYVFKEAFCRVADAIKHDISDCVIFSLEYYEYGLGFGEVPGTPYLDRYCEEIDNDPSKLIEPTKKMNLVSILLLVGF